MTESKTEHGPSLLPYLDDTHGGLHIDIPAARITVTDRESGSSLIESTGPFADLYEGIVTTGSEGGLAPIFLLIQPGVYPPVSSDLDPITNVQVEQLWQTAHQRINDRQNDFFQPVLNEQLDAQGRLLQMRPMFYCAHRNRWCHPRCPHCGEPLSLCRNDQMLQDAGLPEYTTSLERFLYCSSCAAQTGGSLFYAPELASSASEKLNDCNQLIEGFSRLLARKEVAEELPCVACSESTNCYGPKTLVLGRMKPVFFFPFHMLMMPASAINLKEFVELLSGRKKEDILERLDQQSKHGRARMLNRMNLDVTPAGGLLFSGDERRFLEVLYLKLTLLEELDALIPLDNGQIAQPLNSMSLESIWVDLPMQSAHLPQLWNFSLRLIDPVGQPDRTMAGSSVPMARKHYFLGAAWCYILLSGGGQGMAAIRAAVDKLIDDEDLLERAGDIDLEEVDPVFSPRHLMDGDVGEPINPEWTALWRRALLLGLKIFTSGLEPDQTLEEAAFQQETGRLRKEIRQFLFTATPALRKEERAVGTENDAAIAAILKSIISSWPSADTSNPAPEEKTRMSSQLLKAEVSSPPAKDEDGDYVETVILGKDEALEIQPEPLDDARPEMEETVIMRAEDKTSVPPPKAKPKAKPNAKTDAPQEPTPLDATVVIQTDPAQADSTQSNADRWGDMEKTIMMSEPQKGAPPDNDLEKTVVLGAQSAGVSAGSGSNPEKAPKSSTPDEDDLEKTVVIQPQNPKKKSPNHE